MHPDLDAIVSSDEEHDSATALPPNFDGDGKSDNDRLAYISPYN
jgi:hypothetical protein